MNNQSVLLIGELPGFTPQIGRLVSMLNYVRSTTLSAVAGLTVDRLDFQLDSQSNSIGALLLHIAAAEAGYQAATFGQGGTSEDEQQDWEAALALGGSARREIRGHALDYYVTRLARVRERTLAELARRSDAWLDESTSTSVGQSVNNHFKWFHVLTHEVNHRGQIRWLRTRATPSSTAPPHTAGR